MKAEQRYRSLLALIGLVSACTVVAASRWLIGGLLPFWTVCCHMLGMSVNSNVSYWITLSIKSGFVALLVFGVSVLISRLWKTYRFVIGLHSASISVPPTHLTQLVTDLGLSPNVVVLASEVPIAFCFGLLRPRICVSTGLAEALTEKELMAVLLHEDHHRRHYDPLRQLLAEVLAAVLFFLPIAAELRDMFVTTTEIEADRRAVRLAGRPALARALHKMLTHPLATRLPRAAGISGLSATSVRIDELLTDRPAAMRLSAHSLVTSSLIIMLWCTLAQGLLI